MERYCANPYLDLEEKVQLAHSLNVSTKRIAKWFVDRRRNQNRKGMLCESDLTPLKLNTCTL